MSIRYVNSLDDFKFMMASNDDFYAFMRNLIEEVGGDNLWQSFDYEEFYEVYKGTQE